VQPVINNFENNPDQWVEFIMRNELKLDKPDKTRARNSGLTIALSYLIAGLIPLSPYIFIQSTQIALVVSGGVTIAALIVFGYVKAKLIGNNPWHSVWRTLLIGGVAVGVAFLIAKLIA
jgi:VIT1/CCC1 family predicted Fe2+/Mn2+ transporter